MANYRSNSSSLFAGIDWGAVACYAAIVLFGWVAITAASFDEEIGPMFSFAHFYIKQAVWICVAAVVAIFVHVGLPHLHRGLVAPGRYVGTRHGD